MLLADILLPSAEPMPAGFGWILAGWLFAVGACIGSFLNVVILRLPAGISIAEGGSRCPKCLHAIRWYDNIPILSWLVTTWATLPSSQAMTTRY